MQRRSSSILLFIFLLVFGCVEPYVPDEIEANPSFLVVDGFLNATTNSASIRLTRTLPLISDEKQPEVVRGAQVEVQEENGPTVQLTETRPGDYFRSIAVKMDKRYRLRIRVGGKTYSSDWESVFATNPIEAVRWNPGPANMEFFLDTSDPTGKNKFYRWTFSETWEYRTPYTSQYVWRGNDIELRPQEEQIATCWRTDPSFRIIVGSSQELANNVIRNFPIHAIPRGSIKISNRYSINVRQMALSEKAYTYWLNLYKTTESLGSLFDPMPGRVVGNIYNDADISEPVIGYFHACTVTEKRIFFSISDLPRGYAAFLPPQCELDTLLNNRRAFWPGQPLLITEVWSIAGPPEPIGFTTVNEACGDCRALGGGVTTKPDFWP